MGNFFIFITAALCCITVAKAAVSEESASQSAIALPIVQTETAKADSRAQKPSFLSKVIIAMDSESYKTASTQNTSYNNDIESVQYLKLGYKVSDTVSAMAVGTWVQRLGYGSDNSTKTDPTDFQLRLTKSKLFSIGKMSFSSQNRAYLPTTAGSKGRGQIAQVRTYLIGDMALTPKISLNLVSNPRYYIYENGDRKDGVNDFRFSNYGGLTYAFNDAFSVETTLGVFSARVKGGETEYYQDYSTSAYYTLNKHITLNSGIRSVVLGEGGNIDKDGLELYNIKTAEYFFVASLAL